MLELQLAAFRKDQPETIHPGCGMQVSRVDRKPIAIANPDAYLHNRVLECNDCGGEVPAFGRIDTNQLYFAEGGIYD